MSDVIPDGFELMDVKGAILKLQPNDILVIQAKGSVSADGCARIRETVESRYGLKCMVLADDLQLKVLRQSAHVNPTPPSQDTNGTFRWRPKLQSQNITYGTEAWWSRRYTYIALALSFTAMVLISVLWPL